MLAEPRTRISASGEWFPSPQMDVACAQCAAFDLDCFLCAKQCFTMASYVGPRATIGDGRLPLVPTRPELTTLEISRYLCSGCSTRRDPVGRVRRMCIEPRTEQHYPEVWQRGSPFNRECFVQVHCFRVTSDRGGGCLNYSQNLTDAHGDVVVDDAE